MAACRISSTCRWAASSHNRGGAGEFQTIRDPFLKYRTAARFHYYGNLSSSVPPVLSSSRNTHNNVCTRRSIQHHQQVIVVNARSFDVLCSTVAGGGRLRPRRIGATATSSSYWQLTHVSSFSTSPPFFNGEDDKKEDNLCFSNNKNSINNNILPNSSKTVLSDPPVLTWWFRNLPAPVHPYIRLARLDKPIGTWLLLWPCYWSTALAASPGPWPDVSLLALFGVGAVAMRGAGCTINDMWDQSYDRHVARTQNRPLASGELTQTQAWQFLALQMSTGCIVLLSLPHTWYCFQWGVASLPLVATYPLLKRYTNWPQFGLGLVFNWGAWMGWAATYGTMNWWVITPLYLSGVSWTLCYDTLYAHQDKHDDAKLGLKSTALHFGKRTKPVLHFFAFTTYLNWLVVGCTEAFTPTTPILTNSMTAVAASAMDNDDSLLVGTTGELISPDILLQLLPSPDMWYLMGVTAAYGHLIWQIQTAKLDDPNNLATRFRSNAVVGALVFASIVAGKLHVTG